jgi:hypothetical protein
MPSNKRAARVAGLLYLLNSASAPFSLLYIPSTFIVAGDASATANKIRASQLLGRPLLRKRKTEQRSTSISAVKLGSAIKVALSVQN